MANTAKYVGGQPIIGVNPGRERFDGVLLPFAAKELRGQVERVGAGTTRMRAVMMPKARLADGQR